MKKEHSILLVGYRGKPINMPGTRIHSVEGCIPGIMAYAFGHNLYDHDAVIVCVGPDFLGIPATQEAWQKFRRRSGNKVPRLHPRFWQMHQFPEQYPQEIAWNATESEVSKVPSDSPTCVGQSGLELQRRIIESKPEQLHDYRRIVQELRNACILCLRNIIRGSAQNLRVFVCLPESIIRHPFVLSWISEYFDFRHHVDESVTLNRKALLNDPALRELELIDQSCKWPWHCIMDLSHTEPDNEYSMMENAKWGRHWFPENLHAPEDWEDIIPPQEFEHRSMTVWHAHINNAGDGKSLFIRTGHPTTNGDGNSVEGMPCSAGYLLILPAPKRLSRLISTVKKILVGLPLQTASRRIGFPGSSAHPTSGAGDVIAAPEIKTGVKRVKRRAGKVCGGPGSVRKNQETSEIEWPKDGLFKPELDVDGTMTGVYYEKTYYNLGDRKRVRKIFMFLGKKKAFRRTSAIRLPAELKNPRRFFCAGDVKNSKEKSGYSKSEPGKKMELLGKRAINVVPPRKWYIQMYKE